MTCRNGKHTYEHSFPKNWEQKLSGGDGSRFIYTCKNCSLATKIVFVVERDGEKKTSEFIVEPQ